MPRIAATTNQNVGAGSLPFLVRLIAILVVLITLPVGSIAWILTSVAQDLSEVAGSSDAGPSVDASIDASMAALTEVISGARSSMGAADASLASLQDVTIGLESGSRDAAVALENAGELIGGDVAASLEAVDQALPGLVDAASVIDATLQTLSLFGVDYAPNVPLDEALAGLQSGFHGLPAEVEAQGNDLADLAPTLDAAASDTAAVRDSIGSLRTELAAVEGSLAELEAAMDQSNELVSFVAGLGRWTWLLRTLLVLGISAALAVGWALWTVGGKLAVGFGDQDVAVATDSVLAEEAN